MQSSKNRNRARRLVAVGAIAVLSGLQSGVFAQALDRKSAPLAGIRKMTVLVESLDAEARQSGLTEGRLRTIAELKLRLGGVQVLTDEQDRADSEINPYLYVNLNVLPMSEGARYVFSVDLSLRRFISSPVNGEPVAVLLWDAGGIAGAGRSSMPKYAEDYVTEFVESFLNDFLKANPRR